MSPDRVPTVAYECGWLTQEEAANHLLLKEDGKHIYIPHPGFTLQICKGGQVWSSEPEQEVKGQQRQRGEGAVLGPQGPCTPGGKDDST